MEIQISSLPEMERVMGGNPLFALDIKRSVWNEYVYKHILEQLKGDDRQRFLKELQGTVLNEVQHWTHDTPYMAIKDDPQFQALITNLAIELICAKVAKLIEEELGSLDESQSVQLKQIASEVGKQIVCLKISDQFKESMMSIAEVMKQNITQKV